MKIINKFFDSIKLYKDLKDDLCIGCGLDEISKFNDLLGINVPEELAELYLKHNGQLGESRGIFKSMSGYSKVSYLKFLNIDEVIKFYKILISKDEYSTIFKERYLPIGVDKLTSPDDVICIDCKTNEVLLLWVLIYDLFNPVEWQIQRKLVAKSLKEYLLNQCRMY